MAVALQSLPCPYERGALADIKVCAGDMTVTDVIGVEEGFPGTIYPDDSRAVPVKPSHDHVLESNAWWHQKGNEGPAKPFCTPLEHCMNMDTVKSLLPPLKCHW